jgi:peptidoglycan/xylan/chitin deacetylase (PgdA/CDA1 family)
MGRVAVGRAARVLLCLVVLFLACHPASIGASEESANVRVPILVYHNIDYSGDEHSVTPEQLEAQALWLYENGYTAITVWQFWDAVMGNASLPANSVLLTNDDGPVSAFTFAEILGRYGLVGNYFINTNSSLTPDQILTLAQYGPVQAHTVSHQNLAHVGYDAQFAEIANNKAYLEQVTGQTVQFLAWPYGAHDASAVEAARAAGIIAAFGLSGTACLMNSVDTYYVPRISMYVTDDLDTFAGKVSWW